MDFKTCSLETAIKIFTALPDNTTEVSKKSDLTYSHVSKVINDLEERELITSEKVGRVREIKLTVKGKRMKEYFKGIGEML